MDAQLTLDDLRTRWNDVLDNLERHDRVAWIAYFDARLAGFDGHKISLDFSDARKFSGGHEYSPTREKLENSLILAINSVLNIEVIIEEI